MTDDTILIFGEASETLAELLSAGRELGGRIAALVVSPTPDAIVQDLLMRGVNEVLILKAEIQHEPEALTAALEATVARLNPNTILITSTRTGAEVAARLGQRLGTPCCSDCMSLHMEKDVLVVERRVYGGRFLSRQVIEGVPRLATVPPKRFPQAERQGGIDGVSRELDMELPQTRIRTRGITTRSQSALDITKAEIVIAAGRGVKKREDLVLLESLAKALGGVLAGSRPLTGDVDWLPIDRRVGLSGQTIKPNLYIACGISGQIEHIVGMKGARCVVAINSDPKAPIHEEADYSIVGDLYELLPALIEACSGLNAADEPVPDEREHASAERA